MGNAQPLKLKKNISQKKILNDNNSMKQVWLEEPAQVSCFGCY